MKRKMLVAIVIIMAATVVYHFCGDMIEYRRYIVFQPTDRAWLSEGSLSVIQENDLDFYLNDPLELCLEEDLVHLRKLFSDYEDNKILEHSLDAGGKYCRWCTFEFGDNKLAAAAFEQILSAQTPYETKTFFWGKAEYGGYYINHNLLAGYVMVWREGSTLEILYCRDQEAGKYIKEIVRNAKEEKQ